MARKSVKQTSVKPKSLKKGNRVPLLCPRCPKVINQLTQHLRDRHGLRAEAAKTERDSAYRKLLRNIRNFSVLEEQEIKEMMNGEKIDFDATRRLLNRCGHITVEKTDKKKYKGNKDVDRVNIFDEFPCNVDQAVPSRKKIEEAFGTEVDGKRMASRWLYKQYSLRASDVTENFPRKRPNKKQIEQHFESKRWNLGKTQLDVINKVLDKEWSEDREFRKQPDDDMTIIKNIQEQSWGVDLMHNLEGRGSGVFSVSAFAKSEVVCDYQGAITADLSARQAEEEIEKRDSSVYIMQVLHNSKYILIDATHNDGKVGRMINHSRRHDNVKPERRMLKGSLHILLVAKEPIEAGKEILFNYGDKNSTLPDCVPGCIPCIREGRPVVVQNTADGCNQSGSATPKTAKLDETGSHIGEQNESTVVKYAEANTIESALGDRDDSGALEVTDTAVTESGAADCNENGAVEDAKASKTCKPRRKSKKKPVKRLQNRLCKRKL